MMISKLIAWGRTRNEAIDQFAPVRLTTIELAALNDACVFRAAVRDRESS